MHRPQEVPTLTDGVVTLRGHREEDVREVLEQCLDPVSQQWTTVPLDYTLDQAKRFVREAMPVGWATDQEWAFAVEHDGRFGGTVSLRNEGERRAEVAYGSHPQVRGTGAMERAVRLLLEWGFAERDLHTVVWWANRGNFASRRLAWRLGFAIDGTLHSWLPQRGELLDAWVGTLRADDPRSPRHAWFLAPTVESPRLPVRLRANRADDLPRVVEACNDPETARWFEMPQPFEDRDAEELLVRSGEAMARGSALHFAVADATDDRLLGKVGFNHLDLELRSAEVGYWTHPAERGRGVATEAVRLAVRHALLPADDGGLGLVRVTAEVAVPNTGSQRVLAAAGLRPVATRQRAIMTRDGLADAVHFEALTPEVSDPARRSPR